MTIRSPSGTRRVPVPDGALDRKTLAFVAADIADRDGLLKLTLSNVARAVGRHVSSLYGHVDGLDALRREVALLTLDELGTALWEAALGRSGETALRALAAVQRRYILEHPGRSEALLTYQRNDDQEMVQLGRRMAEPFYATLRSFGLDDDAVVQAHRTISALLHGLAVKETAGLYGKAAAADETFEQAIGLFVDALTRGSWPRRKGSFDIVKKRATLPGGV